MVRNRVAELLALERIAPQQLAAERARTAREVALTTGAAQALGNLVPQLVKAGTTVADIYAGALEKQAIAQGEGLAGQQGMRNLVLPEPGKRKPEIGEPDYYMETPQSIAEQRLAQNPNLRQSDNPFEEFFRAPARQAGVAAGAKAVAEARTNAEKTQLSAAREALLMQEALGKQHLQAKELAAQIEKQKNDAATKQRELELLEGKLKQAGELGTRELDIKEKAAAAKAEADAKKAQRAAAAAAAKAQARQERAERLRDLPAKVALDLGKLEASLDEADSVDRLIMKVGPNRFKAAVNAVLTKANLDDSEATTAAAAALAMRARFRRAITGLAASIPEMAEQAQYLPSVEDSPESFAGKMRVFKGGLENELSHAISALSKANFNTKNFATPPQETQTPTRRDRLKQLIKEGVRGPALEKQILDEMKRGLIQQE